MEYSTIAVLATSKDAGEAYAKDIGLEDYRVVMSVAQAQGLRVRNIVVTPGYLQKKQREFWEMFRVFEELERDVTNTNKQHPLWG